jgi:hypothetical protein
MLATGGLLALEVSLWVAQWSDCRPSPTPGQGLQHCSDRYLRLALADTEPMRAPLKPLALGGRAPLALQTAGGPQAEWVAEQLRAVRNGQYPGFEDVEVIADCYGVRRFVRAYRAMG